MRPIPVFQVSEIMSICLNLLNILGSGTKEGFRRGLCSKDIVPFFLRILHFFILFLCTLFQGLANMFCKGPHSKYFLPQCLFFSQCSDIGENLLRKHLKYVLSSSPVSFSSFFFLSLSSLIEDKSMGFRVKSQSSVG